jgi:hypothetical protein
MNQPSSAMLVETAVALVFPLFSLFFVTSGTGGGPRLGFLVGALVATLGGRETAKVGKTFLAVRSWPPAQ